MNSSNFSSEPSGFDAHDPFERPPEPASQSPEQAFSPETLEQARTAAAGYGMVIRKTPAGFKGSAPEFKGLFVRARPTLAECEQAVMDALVVHIADLLTEGHTLPTPGRRSQLNIRISPEEKATLERAAAMLGESVSEFMRRAALEAAARSAS